MRFTLRIMGLVLVLLIFLFLSGCVSSEEKKFEPESTIPAIITAIPETPNLTGLKIPLTLVSVPDAEIIIANEDPNREQCGESTCPTDWFCCNNVCYNPKEPNSGYCCGNSPCPQIWGCCYTNKGPVCFNPEKYQCIDTGASPTPAKISGCGQQSDCRDGTICCMNTCVNPWTNPSNCGGCGRACMGGYSCVNGECRPDPCPAAGEIRCLGKCTDIWFNNNNCGKCGNVCQAGSRCQMGNCV